MDETSTYTETQSPAPEAKPSGSGMTSKVMKGSFWVLMGQVLPLIATFVASPFVIRSLGSESYGVLILVGLISSYFSFADFGMSMASTKFGSEAYGNRSPEKEAMIIRTSALIAFCSSLLITLPMFFFSEQIVSDLLNVPEKLQHQANIALKITAFAFECSILSSVFNTPQLSRLRMDINVLIQGGTKILMTLTTPIVLYLGGGIIEASFVAFFYAAVILTAHLVVSGRLLPQLYQFSVDRKLVRPLMKFGGNMVIFGIGLILLNNLEKFLLTRLVSVRSLAYYSIASTFAGMTSMFSMAMVQTLIPAFSQLLGANKRAELENLFARTVKISLMGLLPSILFLLIIAKPFFTIWAGREYGINSIYPFYILLIGIFFSIIVYVPNCILISSGKSDVFAKFYLFEIVPYAAFAYFLVSNFGIIGAAIAWSAREVVNALFFLYFAKKHTGLAIHVGKNLPDYLLGVAVFIPAIGFALFYNNFSLWLLVLLPASIIAYLIIVWKRILDTNERAFVQAKLSAVKAKLFHRNRIEPAD